MTNESWQYQKGLLWSGLLAAAIFFSLLLFVPRAHGDPAPTPATEDFPPGEDQIVPLAAGERAPFDGQLFDVPTAIRFGFRIERLRLQLQEDVAAAVESCAVQQELLNTKLRLSQERYDFDLQLLRDDRARLESANQELTVSLADAQDTPWYNTFAFGLGVGFVGAVILSLAAVYAVGAL